MKLHTQQRREWQKNEQGQTGVTMIWIQRLEEMWAQHGQTQDKHDQHVPYRLDEEAIGWDHEELCKTNEHFKECL